MIAIARDYREAVSSGAFTLRAAVLLFRIDPASAWPMFARDNFCHFFNLPFKYWHPRFAIEVWNRGEDVVMDIQWVPGASSGKIVLRFSPEPAIELTRLQALDESDFGYIMSKAFTNPLILVA